MASNNFSIAKSTGQPARYDRLSATATFRDRGMVLWPAAVIGIIGSGLLGYRVAIEAVCSGARRVIIWDYDIGQESNLGNQFCQPGVPKVFSTVQACDRIRPSVAAGSCCDVRHAGLSQLRECDVLVDCSDDPGLAWTLTEISNGLRIPLVRCAVDGSGQDVPEVVLSGNLTATGELNVVVARAGVEGGIFASVFFNLHDNDEDGKIRWRPSISLLTWCFKARKGLV